MNLARITVGTPRRMTQTQNIPPQHPLKGVVVVELGHSVAAPFAGKILADLGATVIKIEKPETGDDTRAWGPPFWHDESVTFGVYNGNKHSAAIDIKDKAQCAALREFITTKADVVVQNMRAGLLKSFDLDDSLCDASARLIYCNMAAFGSKGPLVSKPGYDPMMQAFGGIMSITGEEGRPPVRVGPSIVDMSTGMWAVIGILAALQRRHATGQGCVVDTSLYESTLCWIGSAASNYLATGERPKRRGTEMPFLVPYKIFEASDGYLLIAAGNDNLFRRLASTVGHTEWLEDARFNTNPGRVGNKDFVNASVQAIIATQTRAHWSELFERERVPSAILQSIDEVLEHPQTRALEMLQTTPDGRKQFMGTPLAFDGVRGQMERAPPDLGADTQMVLGQKDEA